MGICNAIPIDQKATTEHEKGAPLLAFRISVRLVCFASFEVSLKLGLIEGLRQAECHTLILY